MAGQKQYARENTSTGTRQVDGIVVLIIMRKLLLWSRTPHESYAIFFSDSLEPTTAGAALLTRLCDFDEKGLKTTRSYCIECKTGRCTNVLEGMW